MSAPDLVVLGQVLLRAEPGAHRAAEGIAISGGRVVASGSRAEMRAMAGHRTRVVDEPRLAVVPGLHDFHLHLVGMARQRQEVLLDGLAAKSVVDAVLKGRRSAGWLRGRGWSEAAMSPSVRDRLNDALRERPALLYSHDSHSAWGSPAALAAAGIDDDTPDPPGGRIERDPDGHATGILRESGTDLVDAVAPRVRGSQLQAGLAEVLAELARWGVTAATDAGDPSTDNGVGAYASLGDRASLLLEAAGRIDGRLRMAVGFPAAALADAARLGLATGRPVPGTRTVRAGWAKVFMDGALGSRTAATFDPYTCGEEAEAGILRHTAHELAAILDTAHLSRIGVAVHAIGDLAAATVLDTMQRHPGRAEGMPPDRIEHLQLLRPDDHARLAGAGITASVQPVHCAADRRLVEECWADRARLAYPWRSLAASGALLAFGSDAPIETPNPWIGIFAAVHRRLPGDGTSDWLPGEALQPRAALAGYTSGPATAGNHADEGHLDPGAHADLAVLNVDLATVLAADERLSEVRSQLTMVGGREISLG